MRLTDSPLTTTEMEWDVEKRKVGSRRRTHRRDGQNPARGCSVDAFAFRSRAKPHKKRKERGGAKPEDARDSGV